MIRLAASCAIAVLLSGCAQLSQWVSPGSVDIIIPADTQSTMRVTIPKLNAQGFATLRSRYDGVATWRTADNTSFSFRQGVVVSTRGLGDDLMGADVSQSVSALQGRAGNWAPRINGYMDGEYQPYFTTFQCRRTGSSSEMIESGSRLALTQRTDETCVNDELQIENSYWRNRNGVILKSRQWVSQGVGYMETERGVW